MPIRSQTAADLHVMPWSAACLRSTKPNNATIVYAVAATLRIAPARVPIDLVISFSSNGLNPCGWIAEGQYCDIPTGYRRDPMKRLLTAAPAQGVVHRLHDQRYIDACTRGHTARA